MHAAVEVCEGMVEEVRRVFGEDGIGNYLARDRNYIKQSELCASIFNELKNGLSAEQRELLFSYDEAIGIKEELVVSILNRKAS